jgi:hypothetical protein
MAEDRVAEAVVDKRIQLAVVVGLVDGPVFAQLFGAEDEDFVVAELVILDDGQRFEGFAESDAIGDDAAVVDVDLCGWRL